MKLTKINKPIKCDTVMCNKTSLYEIISNSYKGNMYLCETCFTNFQKLFRRTQNKHD